MCRILHVRGRLAVALVAALALASAASMLSACNTLAGAGEDVSATGHAITSGAEKTKQSLPPSPGPNQ